MPNLQKKSLRVVILSHNRPIFLKECIDSVIGSIKQITADISCSIEISENSSDDLCYKLIKRLYPEIVVLCRNPILTPHEHFTAVINETKQDYLVMFHDDDLMTAEFLPSLYEHIEANPDLTAVASNARKFSHLKLTNDLFLSKKHGVKIINSKGGLLDSYFRYGIRGMAPFPSYMYRVNYIKGLSLVPEEGGKYADVAFLLKVLNRGAFLWDCRVLMQYRIHEQSDTATVKFSDYIKLKNHLKNNYLNDSDSLRHSIRDLQVSIVRLALFRYSLHPNARIYSNRIKLLKIIYVNLIINTIFNDPKKIIYYMHRLIEKNF